MNEELTSPEPDQEGKRDPAPPRKGDFDEVIRYPDGSWQDEEGGFHDGDGGYYPPDFGEEGDTPEDWDDWNRSRGARDQK